MRIPGSDLIFFHFYIAIFRFLLLDVPFLQKRAITKTWLESSVFGIKKAEEIGYLIFEFQISTSIPMSNPTIVAAYGGVHQYTEKPQACNCQRPVFFTLQFACHL